MAEPSKAFADAEIQRLVQLRGYALQLLHKEGDWQEVEDYPGRLRAYEGQDLFILHRTPFQPPPVSEAAMAAGVNAQQQLQAAREYGLDIWRSKKKVLSLIWNEGDAELGVVMFKQGPWEEELRDLAL